MVTWLTVCCTHQEYLWYFISPGINAQPQKQHLQQPELHFPGGVCPTPFEPQANMAEEAGCGAKATELEKSDFLWKWPVARACRTGSWHWQL